MKWFPPNSLDPIDYVTGRDLDSLAKFITEQSGVKSKIKAPAPPATLELTLANHDQIALDDSKDVLVAVSSERTNTRSFSVLSFCSSIRASYTERWWLMYAFLTCLAKLIARCLSLPCLGSFSPSLSLSLFSLASISTPLLGVDTARPLSPFSSKLLKTLPTSRSSFPFSFLFLCFWKGLGRSRRHLHHESPRLNALLSSEKEVHTHSDTKTNALFLFSFLKPSLHPFIYGRSSVSAFPSSIAVSFHKKLRRFHHGCR